MEDVTDTQELRTDPAASELVAACETVWASIQEHHPELPPVVMLLGTGIERGKLVKLGHWWGGRWLADGDIRGEVLLAGEALHLDAADVFEVLLHEAAHGINAARGVKDTSRGGRYHNARFKQTAIEVGLDVATQDPYGFAATSVPAATAERYSGEIDLLASAMRIARRIPPNALQSNTVSNGAGQVPGVTGAGADGTDEKRPKVPPAECGCGRRLRMAPSVLAQGPVVCGNCGSEFLVDRQPRRPLEHDSDATHNPGEQPSEAVELDGDRSDAERLIIGATRGDDGFDVVVTLGTWRSTFGTDAESTLAIGSEADRDRWEQLARAVLTVDGLLHGPDLDARPGLTLQAGDRVITRPAEGYSTLELPEVDTPGVVTDVRPADGRVMVDFATAGVYAIDIDSREADAVTYDYCHVREPEPAVEVDLAEPVDVGIEP